MFSLIFLNLTNTLFEREYEDNHGLLKQICSEMKTNIDLNLL